MRAASISDLEKTPCVRARVYACVCTEHAKIDEKIKIFIKSVEFHNGMHTQMDTHARTHARRFTSMHIM